MQDSTENVGVKDSKSNRGYAFLGILFLVVGGLLLARQLDVYVPKWFFRWEMILIVVGLFAGVRQGFRTFGWLIPVAIGLIFLMNDIWPGHSLSNYAWPLVFFVVGIGFVLSGVRKRTDGARQLTVVPDGKGQDVLDVAAIFGGSKNVIFSKNFKGGEVVSVFGGAEVNLMQADFTGKISIEVVQIFGGTKLIVPSNWQIHSETAAILGGVEDKRSTQVLPDPNKIVILEGTAVFGGIEITSY